MTTDNTANPSIAPAKRQTRRRRPGPFPVTIVRPAATTVVALTTVQRDRRRAANQLAAHLTDATTRGFTPQVDCDYSWPLREVEQAPAIIRDAPVIAAARNPGAVQIGRDPRGRPVAVAIHADTWSLVLRPHPGHLDRAVTGRRPTSWAFLDGYGDWFGLTHMDFCFDDDCTELGVEWDDMVREVLAIVA